MRKAGRRSTKEGAVQRSQRPSPLFGRFCNRAPPTPSRGPAQRPTMEIGEQKQRSQAGRHVPCGNGRRPTAAFFGSVSESSACLFPVYSSWPGCSEACSHRSRPRPHHHAMNGQRPCSTPRSFPTPRSCRLSKPCQASCLCWAPESRRLAKW